MYLFYTKTLLVRIILRACDPNSSDALEHEHIENVSFQMTNVHSVNKKNEIFNYNNFKIES